MSAEEILAAEDFPAVEERLNEISFDKTPTESGGQAGEGTKRKRVDRLNAQCYRLLRHICWNENYHADPSHGPNLVAFLRCSVIPSDLRSALYMDITREAENGVLELIRDDELAREFLGAL